MSNIFVFNPIVVLQALRNADRSVDKFPDAEDLFQGLDDLTGLPKFPKGFRDQYMEFMLKHELIEVSSIDDGDQGTYIVTYKGAILLRKAESLVFEATKKQEKAT